MLSAVRAMAQPRGARPRAHGHAAARPRRHRRGAGRAARRGARERARGRQGGGRARARAAAPCCARPGVVDAGAYGLTVIIAGCLAALRGAGRAAARAPVRARGAAPARARVVELPLLHQLRRHRRRASTRARFVARARGRSATPCWSWATTARCACTCTPTTRTPRSRCSTRAGEVSRFDVADMHEQVADRSARLAGDGAAERPRHLRGRGGGQRRGGEAPVRGARRAGGGRRPDDEPVDLRAAGRHPRGAGRRGGRAAEQPERDPRRRARVRAVREAGARWCPPPRRRRGWPRCSPSTPTGRRSRTPRP